MCEDQEMKEFRTPRDAGYACFRYCSEYKTWHSHESKNCKVWTTDVVDLTNREDFLKFRNAGFVLVDEKRL